jgi:hypothetical protein
VSMLRPTILVLRLSAASMALVLWQGVASADSAATGVKPADASQAANSTEQTNKANEQASPEVVSSDTDTSKDPTQVKASQAKPTDKADDTATADDKAGDNKQTVSDDKKSTASSNEAVTPTATVPAQSAPVAASKDGADVTPPVAATPDSVQPQHESVSVVSSSRQLLPIQPRIVAFARVAMPSTDLAEALPLVPARDNTPPKSNGALAGWRLILAEIVVPQTTSGENPVTPVVAWLDGVFLTALLLLTLVPMTYGLWLRRAGFSTAARSDGLAGSVTNHSLFATPHLLGYTKMPPHPSSPFVVVWQIQMAPSFATLQERRLGI